MFSRLHSGSFLLFVMFLCNQILWEWFIQGNSGLTACPMGADSFQDFLSDNSSHSHQANEDEWLSHRCSVLQYLLNLWRKFLDPIAHKEVKQQHLKPKKLIFYIERCGVLVLKLHDLSYYGNVLIYYLASFWSLLYCLSSFYNSCVNFFILLCSWWIKELHFILFWIIKIYISYAECCKSGFQMS